MRKGFTLIELLVVLSIISILTVIGLVSYRQAGINSRNGKRKADLEQVRTALVLYRSDNSVYPIYTASDGAANFNSMLTTLNTGGYINVTSMAGPNGAASDAYKYSSNATGTTFTLHATTEPNGTDYPLLNP